MNRTQDWEALISLIIPVYNVEKYIAECLQSAINQTFPYLEIICVDDKGSDNSMDIVREFAARDKRIRIVENSTNLGLSGSRNVGMKHSAAPFIMFLDSDDSYDNTMCEKMHEAITSANADIAMCGTRVSYECNAEMRDWDDYYFAIKHTGRHNVDDTLISSLNVCVWNKIYRRELINQYEINFPDGLKYEDNYFFYIYMAHSGSITFVNEKLYYYRRREGSIMNLTYSKASPGYTDLLKITFALHNYYLKWQLLEKKYVHFCRFFFDNVIFALTLTTSQRESENLVSMAADFAGKHLRNTTPLSHRLAKGMEWLLRDFKDKTTAAVFRTKITPFSDVYTLFGIPLYKVEYSRSARKSYICGIRVARLKWIGK